MGVIDIYKRVEDFIGTKFESYAGIVCKHPWKFIIIPILVNVLLGIGLINLSSDNDLERIYTPRNSQAIKDRERLQNVFGDYSGNHFFAQSQLKAAQYGDIIFQPKQSGNILNQALIDEMETVFNQIVSLEFKDNSGSSANYSNICAIRNNDCVVDGSIVFTTDFKNQLQTNTITYPGVGASSLIGIFGDIEVTNNILTRASYLKFRFNIRTDLANSKTDGDSWMTQFLSKMQNIQVNNLNIYYSHANSLEEELNGNISGDILYFSLTFTLMIVYATTATANYRCMSDRQNLAKAGVLGATLSILGSFGIVAGCGLEFVSIVGTMPFLIIDLHWYKPDDRNCSYGHLNMAEQSIGIGVDDMFLLLSGLAGTYENEKCKSAEDRVKQTMRTSGVGITITSLTDLLAFLIGASSTFNSVRNFCVYTGVAVLFCYFNYVTFFAGCMVIHERRVEQGRHCCTCMTISTVDDNSSKDPLYTCLCTGTPPKRRRDVEGPMEKYPPKMFSRFVLLRPVKLCIIIAFAVYLGLSIWGCTQFQQGLVLSQLVADDSYLIQYTNINENHFSSSNLILSVNMLETLQYSKDETWQKVSNLESVIWSVKDVSPNTSLNWYQEFRTSPAFVDTSEINFINNLRSIFLPSAPHYVNDIIFDSSNTSIVASRFHVFSSIVSDSTVQGNLMTSLRDSVLTSTLPNSIVFAPAFIFYEQYVSILPNTFQTLGIAVAAIFVVTAIFLPHPVLVLFVTLTLVMIITGLFGFMYFWDLTLSSITMIHIIMSVGFSVDFSAHICHGFMDSSEPNRNQGARGALIRSGGPILNGALSSIVGIFMLIFSKSFIFRSFFKIMFLIIIFGAAHSLLFLPVILSLVGPKFERKDDLPGNRISTEDKHTVELVSKKIRNEKKEYKNPAFSS